MSECPSEICGHLISLDCASIYFGITEIDLSFKNSRQ